MDRNTIVGGDAAWNDVTVYLFRPDVAEFSAALRRPEDLRLVPLLPEAGLDGVLYFLPDPPNDPPRWLSPLAQIATEIPEVSTSSPGAVMLFRAANRMFAVPFGRGHLRLRSEVLVDDFGLRVAANRLDPEGVVGLDSRAVEQTVFMTRRHASRGTEIGTLGLEADRESVHSLTGKPRDDAFGRRLTGRVGCLLTREVAPGDLPAIAAELLDAYFARDYEQPFGVIDRRRQLDDPQRISELDELLVAGLTTPEHGGAYLAPPEIVDWANVGGFRFNFDPRGTRRQEVSLADYIAAGVDDLRLDRLKADRISLFARDSDRPVATWSVYKSLIAERQDDDGAFVLADGRWWRVHADFIAEIDALVASIPEAEVLLAGYGPHDASEAEYNERAAGLLPGATALDRDLARVRGERGMIELADIAGPGKRLIHIKRGLRAASLSHLFAQAVGSAEALRHLPAVRGQLRSMLETTMPAVAASIEDASMHPGDWEIVIGIVTNSPNRVPGDLPFFSRAHLARAVRALRRLDYQVAYRGIAIVSGRDG